MLTFVSLDKTYRIMHRAYSRIFARLGLRFRAVTADTGAIGGSSSHEFHVLADSGEDAIAFCPGSDYAANIEMAEALAPEAPRTAADGLMQKIATPAKKTCEEVAAFLNLPIEQTVKTIAVIAQGKMHLLLLARRSLPERNQNSQDFLPGGFQVGEGGRNPRKKLVPSGIYRTCRSSASCDCGSYGCGNERLRLRRE